MDEITSAVIAEAASDTAEAQSQAAVEIAAIEANAAVEIAEANAEATIAIAEASIEASNQDDEQWLRDLFAEFQNRLLDDLRALMQPLLTSMETMALNLSILTTPLETGEAPMAGTEAAEVVIVETPPDGGGDRPAPATETAESERARRVRRLM